MNYALYREIITAGTHKAERELPPRAMGLVIEWASRHQAELLDNWHLARQQAEL